jgi:ribosome assembly protein YihI (activator of Der GTPase)
VPLLQALEVESSDTSTLIDKYLEALAEVDSLESETLINQCLEALLEVQRLELELFILQQQQYLDSSE